MKREKSLSVSNLAKVLAFPKLLALQSLPTNFATKASSTTAKPTRKIVNLTYTKKKDKTATESYSPK